MRIGVMSDSHGDEDAVKKAVQSAGNVDKMCIRDRS